jgi:hypothetical protein
MIDPKFKVIATQGNLQLVYRSFYGDKYWYTVAQGNCILWNSNGDSENDLTQAIETLHRLAQ